MAFEGNSTTLAVPDVAWSFFGLADNSLCHAMQADAPVASSGPVRSANGGVLLGASDLPVAVVPGLSTSALVARIHPPQSTLPATAFAKEFL